MEIVEIKDGNDRIVTRYVADPNRLAKCGKPLKLAVIDSHREEVQVVFIERNVSEADQRRVKEVATEYFGMRLGKVADPLREPKTA